MFHNDEYVHRELYKFTTNLIPKNEFKKDGLTDSQEKIRIIDKQNGRYYERLMDAVKAFHAKVNEMTPDNFISFMKSYLLTETEPNLYNEIRKLLPVQLVVFLSLCSKSNKDRKSLLDDLTSSKNIYQFYGDSIQEKKQLIFSPNKNF